MTLDRLADDIAECRRCPRLVSWREQIAADKRAAFRDDTYWGRPVPGFGDTDASILIVGLAPAAHGANRTGRMFTGDRSGDWLYAALFRAGLASQAEATALDDGLELNGVFVTSAVHCAPPDNKPTSGEREQCRPWLESELDLLGDVTTVVALGGFAFDQVLRVLAGRGHAVPRPRPRFGHLGEVRLDGLHLIASFHPSQQNTFTGRLTESMFDAVFARVVEVAGL